MRAMVGQVLAELWTEVDVGIPYSAGSLLARARERGAVHFDYLDAEVRVHGRVDQALAGELVQAARAWRRAKREAEAGRGSAASLDVADGAPPQDS